MTGDGTDRLGGVVRLARVQACAATPSHAEIAGDARTVPVRVSVGRFGVVSGCRAVGAYVARR